MVARKKPRPPSTNLQDTGLPGVSDAEFRRLIDTMLAFSARLLSLRDGLGALIRLRGVQYSTLAAIAYRSGETHLTITRLAEHMHLSGAFVTIETGKLKKLGLINKTSNPLDKREILLSLTEVGRDLLLQLSANRQIVNEVLFDSISPKEFESMSPVFSQMVLNADRAISKLAHLAAEQNPD